MVIVALAVGILLPALFLVLVRTLDLYASGTFTNVIVAFVGGLAAFGGAFFLNTFIMQRLNVTALPQWLIRDAMGVASVGGIPITFAVTTLYVAPIVEELLKSVVLVGLVRRPDFTYFVDGAIYGFASGTAFAVLENPYYLMTRGTAGGVVLMLGRAFSSSLVHGTACALVGVALGRLRFGHGIARFFALVLGWAFAILLHSSFNRVASSNNAIMALGIGIGGVILVAGFIFWGLREERQWLREKLGLDVGVSEREKDVVLRLEDLDELLAPITEVFGEEKRDLVEEFLRIQAQVGIKSKAMALASDEKMRQTLARQVEELRAQMDKLRLKVGVYCMGYVRSIIPPEAISVFERMEVAIAQAEAKEDRGDLFGSLAGRIADGAASQAAGGLFGPQE